MFLYWGHGISTLERAIMDDNELGNKIDKMSYKLEQSCIRYNKTNRGEEFAQLLIRKSLLDLVKGEEKHKQIRLKYGLDKQ